MRTVHASWSCLVPNLTIEQVYAMRGAGFEYGVTGYPLLWSDNGKVTIVSERSDKLFVWEFEPNGDSLCRSYTKEGNHSDIPTGA